MENNGIVLSSKLHLTLTCFFVSFFFVPRLISMQVIISLSKQCQLYDKIVLVVFWDLLVFFFFFLIRICGLNWNNSNNELLHAIFNLKQNNIISDWLTESLSQTINSRQRYQLHCCDSFLLSFFFFFRCFATSWGNFLLFVIYNKIIIIMKKIVLHSEWTKCISYDNWKVTMTVGSQNGNKEC